MNYPELFKHIYISTKRHILFFCFQTIDNQMIA